MNRITEFEIEKIVRSNRKSVTIAVLPNQKLSIKAPNRITKKQINEIITKHRLWIIKRINNYKENKYEPKKFIEGEKLLLLGNEYTLKYAHSYKTPKIANNFILIDNNFHTDLRSFFEFWYKNFALSIFVQKAEKFAPRLNVKYKQIKISNAKTRWGSCSSLKNINLSWKLIMAPTKVIDYVIIHELAHLLELNHSARFWNNVEKIMPDYKQHKLWLKKYGHLLSF